MFDGTTTHIGSLPDEDGTSPRLHAYPRTQTWDTDEKSEQLEASVGGLNGQPTKKQRVGPYSNGLSRKEPMRIEKRASNGKVYLTNKPQFPVELLPDSHNPASNAAGSQAILDNDVLQQQLRLALAEIDKLKFENVKLEKDKKILVDEMRTMQRHKVELITMAKSFHAQSCRARDSLDALGQGPVDYPSAPVPPIHRHQEGRGSPTGARSYTAPPPTSPRFPARPMDGSSSTIIGTQTQEMDHSFRIGRRSVGHYLPMPRHELGMKGPRMDTAMLCYSSGSDENDPPEMLVVEPA